MHAAPHCRTIYTLIYSHSSSCISEKSDHSYIMCLGETLRKGNKRFQNSCTSVQLPGEQRIGLEFKILLGDTG